MRVEGHTDDEGKAETNFTLSQRRAEAVVQAIVGGGVDATRLEAKGFGEAVPIADNATPEGREQNRRVELIVVE